MSIRLYQTKTKPYRSLYQTEGGQVLYKAETPHKLWSRVTTISRAVTGSSSLLDPSSSTSYAGGMRSSWEDLDQLESEDPKKRKDLWEKWGDAASTKSVDSGDLTNTGTSHEFAPLAKIEWSSFGSSTFEWADTGRRDKTSDFFSRSGLSSMGSGRKWIGPDGKTYRWEMNWLAPKLVLMDGSKTTIARFRRQPLHKFSGREYLEIAPEGMHILDAILVTYIYVEKLRKDRERASRSSGGGGGGDGGG